MVVNRKLSDQVYKHLLAAILAGRLAPGTVLRETEVAEQLGVSRTPVREALGRLAADDLLEIAPNRSALVRRLLPEQLKHIFQLREALEGLAAELACGKMKPEDFERLDHLAAEVHLDDLTDGGAACHRLDQELHRLVAARAGNPILMRQISKYHDLVQLVRERVGNTDNGLVVAFRQHLDIIEALRVGDVPWCRRLMIQHIRDSGALAVRCASMQNPPEAETRADRRRKEPPRALKA